MVYRKNLTVLMASVMFLVLGCTTTQPKIPMDWASAQPGEQVTLRGKPVKLLGSPISLGKPLPSVELVDAMTMNEVNLSKEKGSVLLLSLVPSIDTRVCEEQTHYLGEEGNKLPQNINASPSVGTRPLLKNALPKKQNLQMNFFEQVGEKGATKRKEGVGV